MKTLSTATANILCIDQFSNLGGGQRSLLELLPALSEHASQLSVAIPGTGPFTTIVRNLGYRTHNFPSGSYSVKKKTLWQHLKYALEVPGLLKFFSDLVRANDIHLIYVNGSRLVPPAAWVAWRTGTPLVFHCHNRLLQGSAIALTGQALELADAHVIACCHYAAEPLTEYVKPDRLQIIYNGVAKPGNVTALPLRPIRNIGVIGRIERDKGQLDFLKAARIVSQTAPECRFTVIGSPMFSGAEYYNQVVEEGAGLPLEMLTWQDDLAGVYSNLDLLVVPSSMAEATTRVIMEAYAAGVPVVAFPVGGIPEILIDNQTGFLADATTADALAQRIISVLHMDLSSIERIVRCARQEWEGHFTLQAYREGVCKVVSRAMQIDPEDAYDALGARAQTTTD